MSFRPGPPLLYLATAGGIGLTARALLGHPPSLPLALGFLGGYLGLVILGVASPRLQMWGEVLCSLPDDRGVALTLEVRSPEQLQAALPVLRAHQARATFFVPRAVVLSSAPLLREVVAEGHDMGLLGHLSDPWFFARPAERIHDDLARGIEAFQERLGARPWLLRSPGGLSPRLARVASELELTLVGWSQEGAGEPRGGAVVRVRGGEGEASAGYPELPDILGRIAARNLSVVPVSGVGGAAG